MIPESHLEFIIPICGLQLSVDSFNVGSVVFSREQPSDSLSEIINTYQNALYMDMFRSVGGDLTRVDHRVQCFALTHVPADSDRNDLALKNVTDALNLLFLYSLGEWFPDFHVLGMMSATSLRPTVFQKFASGFGWSHSGPLIRSPVISEELLSRWKLAGFERGNKIIAYAQTNKRKNNLEFRIYDALRWFGNGLGGGAFGVKFVNYATALETLLVGSDATNVTSANWAGITQKLAERYAFLTAHGADMRRKVFSKIKNLYQIRSKIVHAGGSATAQEVETIRRAVRLLLLMLLCRDDLTSWPKLEQWIEDEKYGSAPSGLEAISASVYRILKYIDFNVIERSDERINI